MRTDTTLPDTQQLTHLVTSILDDRKADDITTIDLKDKADFADQLIIASGTSARHLSALADYIVKGLKEVGLNPIPIEGQDTCDWVLVDAGDVIIHLFRPEIREHYKLEKMWSMPAAQPAEETQQPVIA